MLQELHFDLYLVGLVAKFLQFAANCSLSASQCFSPLSCKRAGHYPEARKYSILAGNAAKISVIPACAGTTGYFLLP
jgi:hypothetical protein